MLFSRISNVLILTALLAGVREVDSQLDDILVLASSSAGQQQSSTAAVTSIPAPSVLPTATADPIESTTTAAAAVTTAEPVLPTTTTTTSSSSSSPPSPPPPSATSSQGEVPNGTPDPSPGTSATDNKKRPTSANNGGSKPQHSSKNNGNSSGNNNNNNDDDDDAATVAAATEQKQGATPNVASNNPSSDENASKGSSSNSGKEKIGMVAGSVVGGLALVAGLLTWLNRRGGCTSPRRRRYHADQPNTSQDDFSIPMHDARRYIKPASAQGYVSLQDPPAPLHYQQRKQQEAIWDYKPSETYHTGHGQKLNVP